MSQTRSVTVEYFQAASSLDGYIATLLERNMQLIAAVEAKELPGASILEELQADLRALAPAMLEEVRLARSGTAPAANVEALTQSLVNANWRTAMLKYLLAALAIAIPVQAGAPGSLKYPQPRITPEEPPAFDWYDGFPIVPPNLNGTWTAHPKWCSDYGGRISFNKEGTAIIFPDTGATVSIFDENLASLYDLTKPFNYRAFWEAQEGIGFFHWYWWPCNRVH